MKKLFLLLVVGAVVVGCGRKAQRVRGPRPLMTNDVVLPTTPVKNQGRSSLCWVYGMLATIETEHLVKGDSVNLSTDYLARRFLEEQGRECFFTDGKVMGSLRSAQGLSMRGMGSTALRLIGRYGMEPYDSYHNYEGVNYNTLARSVAMLARSAGTLKRFDERLQAMLDEKIGFLPRYIFMLGVEYTPLEFAHSVCLPDEYLALTSFTHHPFHRPFVLESADNHYRDLYLNLPIDSLMALAVKAIRNGHPVCWEGDISEPGFDYAAGVAKLNGGNTVDQRRRQHEFELKRTTDNHVMELCGLAHDAQGHRYFLAKNSWGRTNALGGFMYLSYDYVKLKTIAMFVSREALAPRSPQRATPLQP
jgi:aminopeptidase C